MDEDTVSRRLTFGSTSSVSPSPLRPSPTPIVDSEAHSKTNPMPRRVGLLRHANGGGEESRETPRSLRGSFNALTRDTESQLALIASSSDDKSISTASLRSLAPGFPEAISASASASASVSDSIEMEVSGGAGAGVGDDSVVFGVEAGCGISDAAEYVMFVANETTSWAEEQAEILSRRQMEYLGDLVIVANRVYDLCIEAEAGASANIGAGALIPAGLIDEVQTLLVSDDRVYPDADADTGAGAGVDVDTSTGCLDCAAALLMALSCVGRAASLRAAAVDMRGVDVEDFVGEIPVVKAGAEADRVFQEALIDDTDYDDDDDDEKEDGDDEGSSRPENAVAVDAPNVINREGESGSPLGELDGRDSTPSEADVSVDRSDADSGKFARRVPVHLHVEVPVTGTIEDYVAVRGGGGGREVDSRPGRVDGGAGAGVTPAFNRMSNRFSLNQIDVVDVEVPSSAPAKVKFRPQQQHQHQHVKTHARTKSKSKSRSNSKLKSTHGISRLRRTWTKEGRELYESESGGDLVDATKSGAGTGVDVSPPPSSSKRVQQHKSTSALPTPPITSPIARLRDDKGEGAGTGTGIGTVDGHAVLISTKSPSHTKSHFSPSVSSIPVTGTASASISTSDQSPLSTTQPQSRAEVDRVREGKRRQHWRHPQLQRLTLEDLDILKPISKGGFGAVFLAQLREDGDHGKKGRLLAVKMLSKSEMLRKNTVTRVLAERQILSHTENRFVVRYYSSFHTSEYLYLVMEYLPGGDLFSLLRVMGALDEQVAKYYIAETLLALQYCHSKGIVHRDIKPDNILIGIDGHIRLTDFGLSLYGVDTNAEVLTAPGSGPGTSSGAHSGSAGDSIPTPTSASASTPNASAKFNRYTLDLGKGKSLASILASDENEDADRDGDGDGDGEARRSIILDLGRTAPSSSIREALSADSVAPMSRTPTDPSFSHMHSRTASTATSRRVPATAAPLRTRGFGVFGVGPSGLGPGNMAGGLGEAHEQTGSGRDKHRMDGLRFLAGTPDYLAPEIVLGKEHSYAVDWWALGVMLFEFLTGSPPFNGDSAATVFRAILQGRVQWPEGSEQIISGEARDLVAKLLQLDPATRMGSRGDAAEVRRHPFFADVDWDNMLPPFVPEFEDDNENGIGIADTTYFEPREELHPTTGLLQAHSMAEFPHVGLEGSS